MGDENNRPPLERRVPGATRAGPAEPDRRRPPELPESFRRRIQAVVSAAHAQAEREREAQREQEAKGKSAASPDRPGGAKAWAPSHARDAGAAGGSKLHGGLLRAVLPGSSRGQQGHLSDEDSEFDTAPLPRLTASGAIASPDVKNPQSNGAVNPGQTAQPKPASKPEREHPAGLALHRHAD